MQKNELLLGKSTSYLEEYDPTVLQPIGRNLGRAQLKSDVSVGYDLWRLYEITYLNRKGIPQVAVGSIKVPATSPYIVESKSLKLYIGSLTQTKFSNKDEVAAIIAHDLSKVLETSVEVKLYALNEINEDFNIQKLSGTSIDEEPIEKPVYEPDPKLLVPSGGNYVIETLSSNLLRTLCPVTGQPDHASIMIRYEGEQIDKKALLSYIVSYRRHRGFHEQCCEQIFNDIKQNLRPVKLCVMACFTRRGGIDINPIRNEFSDDLIPLRTIRQ